MDTHGTGQKREPGPGGNPDLPVIVSAKNAAGGRDRDSAQGRVRYPGCQVVPDSVVPN